MDRDRRLCESGGSRGVLVGTREHSALGSGLWMQYDQLLNISAALTSPELWPITWDREPDEPFSLRLPLSNHSSDTYHSCGPGFRGFNMCKTLFLLSRALESKEETRTRERYPIALGHSSVSLPGSPSESSMVEYPQLGPVSFPLILGLYLSIWGFTIFVFACVRQHMLGWVRGKLAGSSLLPSRPVGSDTSCQVSR